jgi:hypothetical protein
MRKYIALVALALCGCQTVSSWFKGEENLPPQNDAKDAYIEKLEGVASDSAAGVLAVSEKLPPDDIKTKVLEAQVVRLSGVKEPSVAKLDEHRRTIANNDSKAAAKDKAEAVKVDKETSELYTKVAALDKKLSDAKAAEEKAVALAKQATKDKSIWYVTSLGVGLIAVGVLVAAFTPKKIAGAIMVAGGMLCASSAWVFESEIYSWVLLGTGALVIVNVGAAITFSIWRFVRDRFFTGQKILDR